MIRLYQFIQHLSIDVSLGAALLCYSISRLINVETPWTVTVGLGIAVWIIYTVDHLYDASKISSKPSIDRHEFHKKHEFSLKCTVVILCVIGLLIAFKMPLSTLISGSILSIAVGLYFFAVHKFKSFYTKEIVISIVYSLGVFLGPISLNQFDLNILITMLMVQLVLLALINLLLFSMIEYELDRKDGHPSMVQKFGLEQVSQWVKVLFIVLLIIQGVMLFIVRFNIQWIVFEILFMLMHFVLFMVFMFRTKLEKHKLYRMAGDGVFFIPSLFLLF